MPEWIKMVTVLPAAPEVIYAAWLSAEGHSEMTGGAAAIDDVVGNVFSAWDGYISGKNEELEPGSLICQSWRTTEFPDDAPDSLLEVEFLKDDRGCKLILKHINIPDGDGEKYRTGWEEHYFKPMKEYFQQQS